MRLKQSNESHGEANCEDQKLSVWQCPIGVHQWQVVRNAKKAWVQLMCWPTNYHCLVGSRVRLIHGGDDMWSNGNGDKGINLVNIQSEK